MAVRRFPLVLAWILVLSMAIPYALFAQEASPPQDSQPARIAPEEAQAAPGPAAKNAHPDAQHDVRRIGQRNVGRGINFYSLSRERAVGASMAADIDRQTKFVSDPAITDYLARVAQKLVRNSDAETAFTVKVVDSLDPNLFSLPGGFLYVNKGLILKLDNEAELASLMAHEIAHVAARHGTRSMTRRYSWDAVSLPLMYMGGPAGFGIRQLGAPLIFQKMGRDAEHEADLLGMQYEYAAGYDPAAFVQALEKLHQVQVERQRVLGKIPLYKQMAKLPLHAFLFNAASSHPQIADRIRRVQTEISTLLPEEQQYILDTSEFDEVKSKLAWENRPILRRPGKDDVVKNKENRPSLRIGDIHVPHLAWAKD